MCKTCTTFSARPSLQNDMDGGVAAALIEEEAEQRACPDLDAHWRLDEAMDRAEKAERERDEVRDAWEGAVESVKEANSLINSLRAAESRPLTADDVTDEMVDRGLDALDEEAAVSVTIPTMRAVLTAALTEPTRPEGAEEIEEVLWNGSEDDEMTVLDSEDRRLISNYLASRGVRVVAEEQS